MRGRQGGPDGGGTGRSVPRPARRGTRGVSRSRGSLSPTRSWRSTGPARRFSKLVVEVTAFTREDFAPPLFEPPAGFAALPDAESLVAAARRAELEELGTTPKQAGRIRIGVAPPGD